jgi:peptidoglycan/LPS O-acetylase OafA/YrhL
MAFLLYELSKRAYELRSNSYHCSTIPVFLKTYMQASTQPSAEPANRLYGLDHLRAFAIIIVFFFHYQTGIFAHPTWVENAAAFGWTGVDLFFVLSGYLIASQLFRELAKNKDISLKDFFTKRFFRILPAYWLVLLLYFMVPGFRERESLRPLWMYLSFTQNIGLDLIHTGTFSHAWSLCVEEHFYLLLPFTLLLLMKTRFFKNGWIVLLLLFLLGFLIRYVSWQYLYSPHEEEERPLLYWYMHIYYPTWNRLDGLLIGVGIAALSQFKPHTWGFIKRYGNLLILSGLLVLTAAYFICADLADLTASVFGFPLVSLAYGLMVAGAVSPGSFLSKWKSSVTAWIATLSYAIYLSHKGIFHVVQQMAKSWHWDTASNWVLMLSIVICLLAAWILHIVIEKPFMKWRQKMLTRTP